MHFVWSRFLNCSFCYCCSFRTLSFTLEFGFRFFRVLFLSSGLITFTVYAHIQQTDFDWMQNSNSSSNRQCEWYVCLPLDLWLRVVKCSLYFEIRKMIYTENTNKRQKSTQFYLFLNGCFHLLNRCLFVDFLFVSLFRIVDEKLATPTLSNDINLFVQLHHIKF